jgi:general secretion pathway protein G
MEKPVSNGGFKAISSRGGRRGFTFVELMVVVSIAVVLITIAIPRYTKAVRLAHESVLRNNLFTLRTVIRNYTAARQEAPRQEAPFELKDLVAFGYLKSLPEDPFTKSNMTWRTINEDTDQGVNPAVQGIVDVKSGSDQRGLDGTRYSDW